MNPIRAVLLMALAAAAQAQQATGPAVTGSALLQPGPTVDPGEFAYVRTLPSGPPELVAVRLDAAVLAHSAFSTAGSFADLRIVDGSNRQLPYLLERLDEPLRVSLSLLPPRTSESHGRSVYELKLPDAGLPAGTLALHTSARVFRREVELEVPRPVDRERRARSVPVVSRATWRHQEPGTPAPPLSIALPRLDSDRLVLSVDEGDNQPLPLTSVELQLPSYRVRFRRPSDAPLKMVYGSPGLAAPEYDLALLRREVLEAPATEITPGAERSQVPASARPPLSRTAFWIILAFATVALVWLIGTLVRMVGQDR